MAAAPARAALREPRIEAAASIAFSRPSLLRQRDAEIRLAAEAVDLVADDVLADRREGLRVGEQHAADIVLEDLLGVAVEAGARRPLLSCGVPRPPPPEIPVGAAPRAGAPR